MSEVEYWLFTGWDLKPTHLPSLGDLQGSCLSKMKICILFDTDLSWQSALSLTHLHSRFFSFPLFFSLSLSCLIEMPLCLSAVFKWWSEEESFQPMLMLNCEQDKEIHPRVLSSRPHLSNALLFTLSTAACKDERQTKQAANKAWYIQSTVLKLQNVPPCSQDTKLRDD